MGGSFPACFLGKICGGVMSFSRPLSAASLISSIFFSPTRACTHVYVKKEKNWRTNFFRVPDIFLGKIQMGWWIRGFSTYCVGFVIVLVLIIIIGKWISLRFFKLFKGTEKGREKRKNGKSLGVVLVGNAGRIWGKQSSWREIWSGSAVKKEGEMVLQVTRCEPDEGT